MNNIEFLLIKIFGGYGDLMAVRVVAKSDVKAERVEDFIDLCRDLVEKSSKEDACIKYELYQDSKESNIYAILEEWRDAEGLNEHLKSAHFQKIFPLISECLEKDCEINIYNKIL